MTALRNIFAWIKNSQASRLRREQAEIVYQAWDRAHRAYLERRDRNDTRGQHEAARSVRDAMTARLRVGA